MAETAVPSSVRLQAENLDLRKALEAANERVAELRQRVSAGTVHVYQDRAGANADDPLVVGLKSAAGQGGGSFSRGAAPEGMVPKADLDRLQAEHAAYAARLNEFIATKDADLARADEEIARLADELDAAQIAAAQAAAVAAVPTPAPTPAPVSSAATAAATAAAVKAATAAATAELELSRRRERDLQKAVADLNAALEARDAEAMEAAVLVSEAEDKKGSARSGGNRAAATAVAACGSESEFTRRLAEQRAQLEDEAMQITCEMQRLVDAATADAQKLQAEVGGLRAARDSALAEKAIALRVMNEAVSKSGKLQSGLETAQARIAALHKQLKESGGSSPAPSAAPATEASPIRLGSDGDDEHDTAELLNTLQDKDAVIEHLKRRLAAVESDSVSDDARRRADVDAATLAVQRDLEGALADVRAKLRETQTRLATTEADAGVLKTERDRALAAGRRAFGERNAALDAAKQAELKHKQLERLQQKLRGQESAATVRDVFQGFDAKYEGVMQAVADAPSEDERQQVIMDALFDNERKIWHLNNDLKSAHTVRELREQDMLAATTQAWTKRCEEYMSAVEILRMQVTALGQQPAC